MNEDHGYICKACGDVAPMGVGYTHVASGAGKASAAVSECGCGYSVHA